MNLSMAYRYSNYINHRKGDVYALGIADRFIFLWIIIRYWPFCRWRGMGMEVVRTLQRSCFLVIVIVSLWMAYQASQNNVEKIHISVDPLRKQYGMGDAVFSVIKIKNLKPIDTPLMKLMIQIDGVTADLAPAGLQNIKLPYTLHQQGESWQFETNITPSSMGWTSIFQTLSVGRQLRFRKCYFIVETAMRQHRVKIPNEILIRLIKIDESVRDWKEESKIK